VHHEPPDVTTGALDVGAALTTPEPEEPAEAELALVVVVVELPVRESSESSRVAFGTLVEVRLAVVVFAATAVDADGVACPYPSQATTSAVAPVAAIARLRVTCRTARSPAARSSIRDE